MSGRRSRRPIERAALALVIALLTGACSGDGATSPGSCEPAGSSTLTARVDGQEFCAATVVHHPLVPGIAHQIAGGSEAGPMLGLIIPMAVGEFSIADPGDEFIGIGGWYTAVPNATTSYLTDGTTGRITVTELTGTRARGTFEFVAIGIDATTGAETGTQVTVTAGAFDAALAVD